MIVPIANHAYLHMLSSLMMIMIIQILLNHNHYLQSIDDYFLLNMLNH